MKTNLLYHLTPMGQYERHLNLLMAHRLLFSGKAAVAISRGTGLAELDFDLLQKHIPSTTFIRVKNTRIRETESFDELFTFVENRKDSVTCYAHSKGVTKSNHEAVRLWTDSLYYLTLFHQEPHLTAMTQHRAKMSGAYFRTGNLPHFPSTPKKSPWHFSGTFYWFVTKHFADAPFTPTKHVYGLEAYPGMIFKRTEVNCVFGAQQNDLYNIKTVRNYISELDKERLLHHQVWPQYKLIIDELSSQPFPASPQSVSKLTELHAIIYNRDAVLDEKLEQLERFNTKHFPNSVALYKDLVTTYARDYRKLYKKPYVPKTQQYETKTINLRKHSQIVRAKSRGFKKSLLHKKS